MLHFIKLQLLYAHLSIEALILHLFNNLKYLCCICIQKRFRKQTENKCKLMEKQTNLFVIGVSGMRHFKRYLIVND